MASAPPVLPHLNFDPTEIARIQIAAAANRRAGASDAMQTELGYAKLAADQQQQAALLAAREQEKRLELDVEREKASQLNAYRQQEHQLNQTRYLEALRIRQQQEERQAAAAAQRMQAMLGIKRDLARGVPMAKAISNYPEAFLASPGALATSMARLQPRQQATPTRSPLSGLPMWFDANGRPVFEPRPNVGSMNEPIERMSLARKNELALMQAEEKRIRLRLGDFPPEYVAKQPELTRADTALKELHKKRATLLKEHEQEHQQRLQRWRERTGGGSMRKVAMKLPDGTIEPVDADKVNNVLKDIPGSEIMGPIGYSAGRTGLDPRAASPPGLGTGGADWGDDDAAVEAYDRELEALLGVGEE